MLELCGLDSDQLLLNSIMINSNLGSRCSGERRAENKSGGKKTEQNTRIKSLLNIWCNSIVRGRLE